MGKVRRKFTIGFKQQVVMEVESGQMTASEACRRYDVAWGVLVNWRSKFAEGKLEGKPSGTELALRAENERLKAKVGELTMLVDLLKKMEDFARQRRNETSSIVTARNLGVLRGGAK